MKEVKSTHVGAYGFIIKDDMVALIKKARGGYKGKGPASCRGFVICKDTGFISI